MSDTTRAVIAVFLAIVGMTIGIALIRTGGNRDA